MGSAVVEKMNKELKSAYTKKITPVKSNPKKKIT
jgi:hypothetical protein